MRNVCWRHRLKFNFRDDDIKKIHTCKTYEAQPGFEHNLRIANNKADNLTVEKRTKSNPLLTIMTNF